MILDGLECEIDGRMAKVTVTLRPSKASTLVFKQVRLFFLVFSVANYGNRIHQL